MNNLVGNSDELEADIKRLLFQYADDYWYDEIPDEDSLYGFLNWINDLIDNNYT